MCLLSQGSTVHHKLNSGTPPDQRLTAHFWEDTLFPVKLFLGSATNQKKKKTPSN